MCRSSALLLLRWSRSRDRHLARLRDELRLDDELARPPDAADLFDALRRVDLPLAVVNARSPDQGGR